MKRCLNAKADADKVVHLLLKVEFPFIGTKVMIVMFSALSGPCGHLEGGRGRERGERLTLICCGCCCAKW